MKGSTCFYDSNSYPTIEQVIFLYHLSKCRIWNENSDIPFIIDRSINRYIKLFQNHSLSCMKG